MGDCMAASVADIAEFLAKVPLFKDLTDRQLNRIAKRIRERDYEAGDAIVEQGQPGIGLYIMVRGEAKVIRKLLDGTEREARSQTVPYLSRLWREPARIEAITLAQCSCGGRGQLCLGVGA